MSAYLLPVIAFVVTALCTPVTIKIAFASGIVDHPGELKPHSRPVPYLGGVAVFAGFAVAVIVDGAATAALGPLGLILLVGLLDDARGLPVVGRIAAEVLAGCLVAAVVGASSAVSIVMVAGGTVVIVNAVNFVDGLDGLAASVCAASLAGAALLVDGTWAASAAALGSAALAFLLFNRPPARIYLGDAGSYLLGAGLAVFAGSVALDYDGRGTPVLVTSGLVLGLVAYPLTELGSTIVRRLVRREPLSQGDREHLYDRMVDAGMSPRAVVLVITGLHLLLVAATVMAHYAESDASAVAVGVAVIAAVLLASVYPCPRRSPT